MPCMDGIGTFVELGRVDVALEDAVELFIAADLYTLDRLKVRERWTKEIRRRLLAPRFVV